MKNKYLVKRVLAFAMAAVISCTAPVSAAAEETAATESLGEETESSEETEDTNTLISASASQKLAEESRAELSAEVEGEEFVLSPKDVVYISFGADTTLKQRRLLMGVAGLSYDNLDSYICYAMTSKYEHKVFDSLVDESLLGDRATVCTFFVETDSDGLDICTYNISDCTPTMYACALVTAGFENGKLIVVAPESTTGVTAIQDVFESYEADSTYLNLSRKEAARSELILMMNLAKKHPNEDPVIRDGIIIYLKGQLVKGKLEDEKSIEKAIDNYVSTNGLSLSNKEVKKIKEYFVSLSGKGFDLERMGKGNKPLLKALNAYLEEKNTSTFQKFINKVKAFFGKFI